VAEAELLSGGMWAVLAMQGLLAFLVGGVEECLCLAQAVEAGAGEEGMAQLGLQGEVALEALMEQG